jgi:hypothetical protein
MHVVVEKINTMVLEKNNILIQKLPAMSGVAMCTIFITKFTQWSWKIRTF